MQRGIVTQWNVSFGRPPFRGHKFCSRKIQMFLYIIFVLVTSNKGTPPFRGHFSLSLGCPPNGGFTVYMASFPLCFRRARNRSDRFALIFCQRLSVIMYRPAFNFLFDLHQEFSAGWDPWGVGVWSVVDVAVWCVPRMVTSHPGNVFLESLVKVEQWPRHDHVIVHWH